MLGLRDRSNEPRNMRDFPNVYCIDKESGPWREIPQKLFSPHLRPNSDRNKTTIPPFCHVLRMAAVTPPSLGVVGRDDDQRHAMKRGRRGRSSSVFEVFAPQYGDSTSFGSVKKCVILSPVERRTHPAAWLAFRRKNRAVSIPAHCSLFDFPSANPGSC